MCDCEEIDERDEDVIVSEILRFDEFNAFYSTERKPTKTEVPIKWIIKPSCKGFAAQGIDANGTDYIELRHNPKTREDAFLVAHEITHLIRKKIDKQYLNFSKVNDAILEKYTIDDMGEFASRIGSMFDDPIIDHFLKDKYGFNPEHHYTRVVIPDSIKNLNRGDARDELHRLNQAMFYVQYALQWDAIDNVGALRKWHNFKRLYQRQRPIAKRIGEDLYSMAKETGLDTLDKQKQLFNKIADKYSLNGIKLKDILYIE